MQSFNLTLILNKNCTVSRAGDPLLKDDDHHPALIVTSSFLSTNDNAFPLENRHTLNYKKCNFNLLYEEIINTDWSNLSNFNNVDDMLNEFYNTLNLLHKYVPLKS